VPEQPGGLPVSGLAVDGPISCCLHSKAERSDAHRDVRTYVYLTYLPSCSQNTAARSRSTAEHVAATIDPAHTASSIEAPNPKNRLCRRRRKARTEHTSDFEGLGFEHWNKATSSESHHAMTPLRPITMSIFCQIAATTDHAGHQATYRAAFAEERLLPIAMAEGERSARSRDAQSSNWDGGRSMASRALWTPAAPPRRGARDGTSDHTSRMTDHKRRRRQRRGL